MTDESVAVSEAFPAGAWERACLEAARRRAAGWSTTLPGGSDLRVDLSTRKPTSGLRVRLQAGGSAALWVSLDNPTSWWPQAPGWETTEWRDVLILQALQPLLEGLRPWLACSEDFQCQWYQMELPSLEAATLGMQWAVNGEDRRIVLTWSSAAEAVARWSAQADIIDSDGYDEDDHDVGQEEIASMDTEPAWGQSAEVRRCLAALCLDESETNSIQRGGGLVLGREADIGREWWMRAGHRWLLANALFDDPSHYPDEDVASRSPLSLEDPHAINWALPTLAEDSSLRVLSAPLYISPGRVLAGHMPSTVHEGNECLLWLRGRAAGRGRIVSHEGVVVVRVQEWQP